MSAPKPTITPYRNGPLIVRGAVEIVNTDGAKLDSRRTTVALCRCGVSQIKPWCDGSHKLIDFTTES